MLRITTCVHVSCYNPIELCARLRQETKRLYRKSAIQESTYPNEFYVLPYSELRVGVEGVEASRQTWNSR